MICDKYDKPHHHTRVKDPPGESIILPLSEFERIESTSRALTKEEKEAQREAHQRKKEEKMVGHMKNTKFCFTLEIYNKATYTPPEKCRRNEASDLQSGPVL